MNSNNIYDDNSTHNAKHDSNSSGSAMMVAPHGSLVAPHVFIG